MGLPAWGRARWVRRLLAELKISKPRLNLLKLPLMYVYTCAILIAIDLQVLHCSTYFHARRNFTIIRIHVPVHTRACMHAHALQCGLGYPSL